MRSQQRPVLDRFETAWSRLGATIVAAVALAACAGVRSPELAPGSAAAHVPHEQLGNGDAMSSLSWASRVGTLAHELVHILQYDIAGGRRGTSEQWLREGFAEWVSLDVLQRIGGLPPGAAKRHFEDDLAASRRDRRRG
mgnify:CR=1 FL=1